MNTLTKDVYDKIKDDATFKTLTGATASDPRLYYAYPWEPKLLSSTQKAYVTYYTISGAIPPDAVHVVQEPDKTFVLDVFSNDVNQGILIQERLVNLLHSQKFDSTNYLGIVMKFDGANEILEENITDSQKNVRGSVTRINMRFTLGPIVRKSGKFYSYR